MLSLPYMDDDALIFKVMPFPNRLKGMQVPERSFTMVTLIHLGASNIMISTFRTFFQQRQTERMVGLMRRMPSLDDDRLNEHVHALDVCFKNGANPEVFIDGHPAMAWAMLDGVCSENHRWHVVDLFLRSGASITTVVDGEPFVHQASRQGLWSVFERLVKHGADPLEYHHGQDALHVSQDTRITRFLLDAGASLAASSDGMTPLNVAVERLQRYQSVSPSIFPHRLKEQERAVQNAQRHLAMIEAHVLEASAKVSCVMLSPAPTP